MEALAESGYSGLMCYLVQQIEQFQLRGQEYSMQRTAVNPMAEVPEELKASVIEGIPAERRLRGLSAAERLRGLTPEQILECVPPEELLRRLTREERTQLRDLLEQESPN